MHLNFSRTSFEYSQSNHAHMVTKRGGGMCVWGGDHYSLGKGVITHPDQSERRERA